jgi:hypothetical protein
MKCDSDMKKFEKVRYLYIIYRNISLRITKRHLKTNTLTLPSHSLKIVLKIVKFWLNLLKSRPK